MEFLDLSRGLFNQQSYFIFSPPSSISEGSYRILGMKEDSQNIHLAHVF